ncbi:MAG: hypothetical protein K6U87_06125 [Firmicutes bacterium]|nr:hypothetical protein [Bacillota bacterium]
MADDEAKRQMARALWRQIEGLRRRGLWAEAEASRRMAMRLCAEARGGGERGGRFFDAEGVELDEADLEDWLDQ